MTFNSTMMNYKYELCDDLEICGIISFIIGIIREIKLSYKEKETWADI